MGRSMADGGGWQADRFVRELAGVLTGFLDAPPDTDIIQRVLAATVTAAESACAGRPCDCGPGCPHCCVLNVAILLPEGLVIAGWLQDRLSPPEFAVLHDRLARHRCWVRWMEDDERILKQATCPFLVDDGRCMIYPVRPLVCRAAHSLDRGSCAKAFNPVFTGERQAVPVDLLRQAACDAAFVTLAESLQSHGLDDRSIELGAGVLAFLDEPGHADRLLAGERLPQSLWEG